MPELPEVETIKTAIERSIGYCNIIKLIVNNNKLREKIPDEMSDIVEGQRIVSYQRRAKYILLHLSNGYSIIWHLGMSGRVTIADTLPEIPGKHDHVIVQTENGYLIYNDVRRFGVFTYVRTDELSHCRFFEKCGIEPFDSQLDGAYLHKRLQHKKTPVKIALLDQSLIVGIGNIYASESLYLARILPTRPCDGLSLKDCNLIVKSVREVLEKAVAAGGSTLKDYQKPDGSLGYFQNMHCVYNKTGQKCPHCQCDVNQTGGIRKIVQAGRSSFYCPVKQK